MGKEKPYGPVRSDGAVGCRPQIRIAHNEGLLYGQQTFYKFRSKILKKQTIVSNPISLFKKQLQGITKQSGVLTRHWIDWVVEREICAD